MSVEQAEPHWRRVCSAANISDPISRKDLTIAHQNGWREIHMNWDDMYKELATNTASLQQALNSHPRLKKIAMTGCETMAGPSRTTMDGVASGSARTDAASDVRPTSGIASKKYERCCKPGRESE